MASTKGVLLITEKKDSDFSKKVINAAELSKTEVIISSATFQTFSKVLEGKVGVVVLDHDELGGVADHIFRAIRIFHSTTPVLMAYSKKMILEQLIGRVHDGEVSVEDLAKIMVDAIDFDEEITRDLNLSYAVEKDVTLHRMAEILARSIEFDKELKVAQKEFLRQFEEKGISNLTGKALDKAISEIRKNAYSSPVFTNLRTQMEQKAKEYKGDVCKILH